MAQIVFESIPGTHLYQPASPAANEALLFFSTASSGKKRALSPLTLDETWAGAPIGYYLFLKKLPDDASKFEQEAAKALDTAMQPPEHSSFAWLTWDGKTATVVARVVMKAAISGDPTVDKDESISIPGFPGVGVAAASPVPGSKDQQGFLNGFFFTYPPQSAHDGQPASGPPWGAGMTVPMSGDYAGCLRFEALLNSPTSSGSAARKQVAVVSLDPVRPTDSRRTRISLTGVLLDFGQLPSGAFYLKPV
jgi:hypothetical protein